MAFLQIPVGFVVAGILSANRGLLQVQNVGVLQLVILLVAVLLILGYLFILARSRRLVRQDETTMDDAARRALQRLENTETLEELGEKTPTQPSVAASADPVVPKPIPSSIRSAVPAISLFEDEDTVSLGPLDTPSKSQPESAGDFAPAPVLSATPFGGQPQPSFVNTVLPSDAAGGSFTLQPALTAPPFGMQSQPDFANTLLDSAEAEGSLVLAVPSAAPQLEKQPQSDLAAIPASVMFVSTQELLVPETAQHSGPPAEQSSKTTYFVPPSEGVQDAANAPPRQPLQNALPNEPNTAPPPSGAGSAAGEATFSSMAPPKEERIAHVPLPSEELLPATHADAAPEPEAGNTRHLPPLYFPGASLPSDTMLSGSTHTTGFLPALQPLAATTLQPAYTPPQSPALQQPNIWAGQTPARPKPPQPEPRINNRALPQLHENPWMTSTLPTTRQLSTMRQPPAARLPAHQTLRRPSHAGRYRTRMQPASPWRQGSPNAVGQSGRLPNGRSGPNTNPLNRR